MRSLKCNAGSCDSPDWERFSMTCKCLVVVAFVLLCSESTSQSSIEAIGKMLAKKLNISGHFQCFWAEERKKLASCFYIGSAHYFEYSWICRS